MSSYQSMLVDLIGITIAALYTFAGQAHFTDRLTPSMAEKVEHMTHNSHAAFWFFGLNYKNLKHLFGFLDLLGAALLWRKSTRRAGLTMAVVGFGGGLYGQLYSGDDATQVSALLGLAVVGRLLA